MKELYVENYKILLKDSLTKLKEEAYFVYGCKESVLQKYDFSPN